MGEVVAYAKVLVDELRAAGVRATADAASAVPPCALVVPIPGRTYDLQHGYTGKWSVVCLAPAPGGIKAAEQLEDLADKVAALPSITVETAEPVAYRLPSSADPVPAYLLTFFKNHEVDHA